MIPRFAVVGHPNKGKSTIVAALAMDDSVAISNMPGTTTKAKEYSLKIDNKTIYTLIDTPGFQRPRAILQWLNSQNAPAHKKMQILKEFIQKYKKNPKFNDDIELLTPIANGAGIIYVVDASKPYSVEFELDMQILSYAGAPSLAILNFIDDSDYSQEWQEALKHYFKLIKKFNPMKADIDAYIDLLSAFGHLNLQWQDGIKEAINAFKKLYNNRINLSAKEITDLIFKVISYTKSIKIESDSNIIRDKLKEQFFNDIVKFEQQSFANIKHIWDHNRAQIEQKSFGFDGIELFSKESEKYFGLTQNELITYSATIGGTIGAGVDAAFFGHTLLLGAAIGAVAGAIGGYMGFEKMADIKILGQQLGGKMLQIGPIKNINFGFILLNRALFLTTQIATMSHAKREALKIENIKSVLTQNSKKEFFKLHKQIINSAENKNTKEEYQQLVKTILSRVNA